MILDHNVEFNVGTKFWLVEATVTGRYSLIFNMPNLIFDSNTNPAINYLYKQEVGFIDVDSKNKLYISGADIAWSKSMHKYVKNYHVVYKDTQTLINDVSSILLKSNTFDKLIKEMKIKHNKR